MTGENQRRNAIALTRGHTFSRPFACLLAYGSRRLYAIEHKAVRTQLAQGQQPRQLEDRRKTVGPNEVGFLTYRDPLPIDRGPTHDAERSLRSEQEARIV